MSEHRVTAIDPGKVHVGVAFTYTPVDEFPYTYHTTPERVLSDIELSKPGILVIESFRNRAGKFLRGSQNETSMLIARLQEVGEQAGSKIVMQDPSIKSVIKRMPWWKRYVDKIGITGRTTHELDAVMHWLYYTHVMKGL